MECVGVGDVGCLSAGVPLPLWNAAQEREQERTLKSSKAPWRSHNEIELDIRSIMEAHHLLAALRFRSG